jgi:hypothetical protein
MLNKHFKSIIETWQFGVVATTDADGAPNVWPKDNFVLQDESTLSFPEIRSLATLSNLAERPTVEVLFIDQLNQYGVRIRGEARCISPTDPEFSSLIRPHIAQCIELAGQIKALVVIDIKDAVPTRTLAVDAEADLSERRAKSMQRLRDINIKLFASERSEC